MSIIRYTKDANIKYAYLNIFPDQFKTEKEKSKPSYVKNTLDYFSNRAYAEYITHRDTFVKNYDLLKGILRNEDFYQDPDVKSFTESLIGDLALPKYVKHYSIMTTPVNELVGEISKRPDTYKVKAFDDDSKAEELQYKTEMLQQYVIEKARQKIIEKAQMSGEELSDEEVQQISLEQVKDQLDSYTSVAEKWANKILEAHKAGFNIKEKSEEVFRDLLTVAREFFLIYEDNSKLGFNIDAVNPKNEWHLTTPDKKYISDPSGRGQGAYAAGTVHVMELSEIIETFPEITKDEIDHLRTSLEDYGLINARDSNLGKAATTPGQDSIQYDTYDPLVLQTRMILESEMKENSDTLQDFLGLTSNVSSFGYKYVVMRAYWISKKKIGKVTFEDEMGNVQSLLVDENYKSGNIPTQISLDWGWVNQWYQGVKIGPDIYHMKPYKLLDYCPIIGTLFEVKNTEARSLVDMMKPFQVIYNICMNQMYKLLEKEIGNVAAVNIRRVPRVKDGDAQDDIDIWEMEARERGILFDDDSPENTKAPVSNQSVARNIDLTRTNEIQSRYNSAIQIKNECWELVGLSKQRLGSVSASESATGTNTAVQQSYSQTEPLFVAHEYVMRQLYQAIIDASQYIESNKELSTISHITSEGDSSFIQVNGTDLKFRDLMVFPTNRPEDTKMFNELRSLAQPAMQNGASFYDVIELWSTNSVREVKRKFKDLRDYNQKMQQQAQEMEQQKIDQQQQIAAATMEQEKLQKKEEMINQNYQNELDRINKKEIALINASSKDGGEVAPVDNSSDLLKLNNEREKLSKEHITKLADIQSKMVQNAQKMALEREKLQVARENMKNDEKIAHINASNRNKTNSK